MDIIVTTPKSEMANAAQEAADCIRAGGGEYFRRFPHSQAPKVEPGDRVYYVEDGFIRGFCVVHHIDDLRDAAGKMCDSTGRVWPNGVYVCMRADSWTWIRPIPMRGFQGFRYVEWGGGDSPRDNISGGMGGWTGVIEHLGGWRDPKPKAPHV